MRRGSGRLLKRWRMRSRENGEVERLPDTIGLAGSFFSTILRTMMQEETMEEWLEKVDQDYLAHISLDCVVFGFHAGQLKILLLKMKHEDRRALPGGFVRMDETLEQAATRTLRERTGLENIFLQQFGIFSDPARSDPEE